MEACKEKLEEMGVPQIQSSDGITPGSIVHIPITTSTLSKGEKGGPHSEN